MAFGMKDGYNISQAKPPPHTHSNKSPMATRVPTNKHDVTHMKCLHTYLDNSIHGSRPGHRLQRRRQRAQARQKPGRPRRHKRRDKARPLIAPERKRGQGKG